MNITTLVITALVSFVTGSIVALRYGVSISGMVRADIGLIHAKADALAAKVTAEIASLRGQCRRQFQMLVCWRQATANRQQSW
jgi:hypothetical protein